MVPLISTICITRFIYTFSISLFMFLEIHIFAPDGRRPRRAAKGQDIAIRIARNGPCMRGFGEHKRAKIWPQRSERMRAEQGPSPLRIKGRSACRLLGAGFFRAFSNNRPSQGWRGRFLIHITKYTYSSIPKKYISLSGNNPLSWSDNFE